VTFGLEKRFGVYWLLITSFALFIAGLTVLGVVLF
jgi:hypothetical protein